MSLNSKLFSDIYILQVIARIICNGTTTSVWQLAQLGEQGTGIPFYVGGSSPSLSHRLDNNRNNSFHTFHCRLFTSLAVGVNG